MDTPNAEIEKCTCKVIPSADDLHPCVYVEEFSDKDDEPVLCHCCSYCQYQCKLNI